MEQEAKIEYLIELTHAKDKCLSAVLGYGGVRLVGYNDKNRLSFNSIELAEKWIEENSLNRNNYFISQHIYY